MTDGNETLHFVLCSNFHGLRLWTKYFVDADEVDAFLFNVKKTIADTPNSIRNSYKACKVSVGSDGLVHESKVVTRFTIY